MAYDGNIGPQKLLARFEGVSKGAVFQIPRDMFERIPFFKGREPVVGKNCAPSGIQRVHISLNRLTIKACVCLEHSNSQSKMLKPWCFSHFLGQKADKPEIDLAPMKLWGVDNIL